MLNDNSLYGKKFRQYHLRIDQRFSKILKTSQKAYEGMFFDTKKYIYFESSLNPLYTDIKQMLQKFPSGKMNVT